MFDQDILENMIRWFYCLWHPSHSLSCRWWVLSANHSFTAFTCKPLLGSSLTALQAWNCYIIQQGLMLHDNNTSLPIHDSIFIALLQISDIVYRTTGCTNSESRPQDPAAESNRKYIEQCTGKRTCVVPADNIRPPFLPKKPANCGLPTKYQINVAYVCVEQGKYCL